tara:strand:+ start:1197 stop:1391 length:195 start_codon:yes stop_codon:yes gene_type:complete
MEQIYYELEGSIKCLRDYIKEKKLFANGKLNSFAVFDAQLEEILGHYYQTDPEFNEDIQDMIEY